MELYDTKNVRFAIKRGAGYNIRKETFYNVPTHKAGKFKVETQGLHSSDAFVVQKYLVRHGRSFRNSAINTGETNLLMHKGKSNRDRTLQKGRFWRRGDFFVFGVCEGSVL